MLQCRVGPMLSSVFQNKKTHFSEIFYFNISEYQTYSKYYQYIPIVSPHYKPPNVSAHARKPT